MKVKKLVKIILVAPSYLIVSYNGNNQTVHCDTTGYTIGDMYEMEEDSKIESISIPIKKNKFRPTNDEKQQEEV